MVFIVVEVMVAEVAVLTGVALIVSVVVALVVVIDFLRRFFSIPRGRKRLAVLATGFR